MVAAVATEHRIRQALFVADGPHGERLAFVILDDDRCAVTCDDAFLCVASHEDDPAAVDRVLNEFLRLAGRSMVRSD